MGSITHLLEKKEFIIETPLLAFIHFLDKPSTHVWGIIGELAQRIKRL